METNSIFVTIMKIMLTDIHDIIFIMSQERRSLCYYSHGEKKAYSCDIMGIITQKLENR